MVSLTQGRVFASSANPPHKSTTVSPSRVAQQEAPMSAPLAKLDSKASRAARKRSSTKPSTMVSGNAFLLGGTAFERSRLCCRVNGCEDRSAGLDSLGCREARIFPNNGDRKFGLLAAKDWAMPARIATEGRPGEFTTTSMRGARRRIVQRKMILKRDLFLMQDDPENGRCWIGTPLGNADRNAECRESHPFANWRILEGQRGDRVCRPNPCRSVRLGAEDAGGARVWAAGQEDEGSDP